MTKTGEVIVCWQGKGEDTDIFFGIPTPDMQPVDREAEEISPRRSLNSGDSKRGQRDYSQSALIDRFQSEMGEVRNQSLPRSSVPLRPHIGHRQAG